jgi:3-oxoacyl-[acyl-carrier protein] reductase
MDLGLTGKRAIVTGGIGRAVVNLLVAEGCDVGLCARDAKQVDAAVAALSRSGRKVIGGAVDVTDSAGLRRWVTETAQSLGGLDILVPNASALVETADEDAWRLGMEVDILGTVRAVEAAMPFLEKSGSAAIVGIASGAAIAVSGGMRAYTGHKAAVIAYMSSLSSVYGRNGIRANTVSPGAVYFDGGVWDHRKRNEPERYAGAIKRAPFGRLGKPEEVANAVVFLASPAASYISGTNLMVDGAATSRIQY